MVASPVTHGELFTEGGNEEMIRKDISPEKPVTSKEDSRADTNVL